MSSAFFIHATVIENVPGGPSQGEYKKIYRDLGEAIGDFVRLINFSEDIELRFSS